MAATKGLALALEFAGPSCAASTAALAAASVPVIAYSLRPGAHRAAAASLALPGLSPSMFREAPGSTVAELKPILGIFHPVNLLKVLIKNVGIQIVMKFNVYMADYLEHEKQAIAAEEQGQQPPEPPPLPDFKPALERGWSQFIREVLVTTTRRIYEHMAVARMPPVRAEAVLRDHRAWIKNVLSVRHRKDSIATKLFKYQFATLHSTALFYAADCTVSIAYHTRNTLLRDDKSPGDKAVWWAKGAALQVGRCSITLLAVSVGAAVGSLVKPGVGTFVGQLSTDIAVSVCCGMVISSVLDR